MGTFEPKRVTIGQSMAGIAAIAMVIAVMVSPGAGRSASLIAGFLGLGLVVVALFVAVIDLVLGVRCPHCGAWSMCRNSVHSFRDRFYRCTSCQARCRRSFLRGWDDASGPEFDPIYARKRAENPWTAPPSLDDEEDLIFSKTHVDLLRNKHRRNPNPPDQTITRHD